MKKIILLFLACVIAGCDQIKDEFHTSGGYVAPLLDGSAFPAITQKEQLDRYYYIIALASPLALYTVSDEDGARDTILHVSQALKAIKAYDASLKVCVNREKYSTIAPAQTQNCTLTETVDDVTYARDITETSYGFEANGLKTQRAMARLASDIKNNVGLKLETDNPLDSVTSALNVVLKLKELIGPMRDFAAAYRDSIHIATFSVARMCKKNNAKPKKNSDCGKLTKAVDDYYIKGERPTATLTPEASQDPERVLKTLEKRVKNVISGNELSKVGFLDKEAILALNAQIYTACMRAARHVEDWDDKDNDKKYCSGLNLPDLVEEEEKNAEATEEQSTSADAT